MADFPAFGLFVFTLNYEQSSCGGIGFIWLNRISSWLRQLTGNGNAWLFELVRRDWWWLVLAACLVWAIENMLEGNTLIEIWSVRSWSPYGRRDPSP
jgi:hypothetical protein